MIIVSRGKNVNIDFISNFIIYIKYRFLIYNLIIKVIRGSRKKKSANLEKIRLKSHIKEVQPPPPQPQNSNSLTSVTNTDRLSLSGQSVESGQNDTLLLVTNEMAKTSKGGEPKKRSRRKNKTDLQIVSFEVRKKNYYPKLVA